MNSREGKPWQRPPLTNQEMAGVTPEMNQTFDLLLGLSEAQRGLVLCWFCSDCYRYVGPGDHCTCMRDE